MALLPDVARSALAAIFVLAAATKLLDLSAFRMTLVLVGIVPRRAVPAVALVIPMLELSVGLMLVAIPGGAPESAAIALLIAFTATLWRSMREGLSSCACFGAGGRLDYGTAARNTALVALAATAMWSSGNGGVVLQTLVHAPATQLLALGVFTTLGPFVVGASVSAWQSGARLADANVVRRSRELHRITT